MTDFSRLYDMPAELSKMSMPELYQLAEEIRAFLVQNVSKTGGHLASNLGVVELTIALHCVFSFPEDKLIWDVGHQSYVHKILTGRAARFPTLRKFGGLSGFPKTSESEYDCFNTGHSSTSVSAALGMARSRDLKGEHHHVAAVFGDGALTGGMLFEALNDGGHKKTPCVLVLNDNAMSISKNVGAIAKHLRNLRSKPGYTKSKSIVERGLTRIPAVGKPLADLIRTVKQKLKMLILPTTFFNELGFDYLGPIDGHDLENLISALTVAKNSQHPIVVHVHTKKGKGYSPAEQNPQVFHGISGFDLEHANDFPAQPDDYSAVFGKTLCTLAKSTPEIVAITAAMPSGTGLMDFAAQFPDRFFDTGIAEQHAATLAAGFAAGGMIPVFPVYASFFQRAYDQVLHDVCLQNLHVVFCADRAGIVGADGETHHGLFDISCLSAMPNMSILAPSSFEELSDMLSYAILEHKGPITIRYPRGGTQGTTHRSFAFGKARKLADGEDITIISYGRMVSTAEKITEQLAKDGVSAELITLPTVCPLDREQLIHSISKTGAAAVLEDHVIDGGIGSAVGTLISEEGLSAKLLRFAFPREPIVQGSIRELDQKYGLDEKTVVCKTEEFINERKSKA